MVSDAFKRAVLGIRSEQVALTLLTFSGNGFTTFRVCDNDTDIVSNGNTFVSYPFEIEHPGDREEAPAGRLRIANVSREIGQAIDAAIDDVFVKIEVILASNPDNPEKTFDGLRVTRSPRSMLVIEADLASAQFADEPYPATRATPGRFPGLFP